MLLPKPRRRSLRVDPGKEPPLKPKLDSVYIPSEDVIARDIEGELIIVPLASGMGDMEDELFTVNETARAIWERLDGKRSLRDVVKALSGEYKAPAGKIEKDVSGLVGEFLKRRMLVEAPQRSPAAKGRKK
jgi:hypothetical protein